KHHPQQLGWICCWPYLHRLLLVQSRLLPFPPKPPSYLLALTLLPLAPLNALCCPPAPQTPYRHSLPPFRSSSPPLRRSHHPLPPIPRPRSQAPHPGGPQQCWRTAGPRPSLRGASHSTPLPAPLSPPLPVPHSPALPAPSHPSPSPAARYLTLPPLPVPLPQPRPTRPTDSHTTTTRTSLLRSHPHSPHLPLHATARQSIASWENLPHAHPPLAVLGFLELSQD
ncbi:unnamed protein product, partial [Closterium sp. NIES-54]